MVTPDAERTMNTFLGITGAFSRGELVEKAIADSEYLYSEGYLVTSDTARPAVVEARRMAEKHGVKTAISFSDPAMVKYFKPGLKKILGQGVDLLFCNETEAGLFTETDSLDRAVDELKRVARTFVVTRGSRGALVCDGDRCFSIDPHPVRAVDTNGAGDMFAGAFLYGLTHGFSHEQAGNLASLASSKVVETFGPRLPAGTMQQLLTDFRAEAGEEVNALSV
jgi:sugar/nucleoside kinase (ribokinase family)